MARNDCPLCKGKGKFKDVTRDILAMKSAQNAKTVKAMDAKEGGWDVPCPLCHGRKIPQDKQWKDDIRKADREAGWDHE